MILVIKKFFSGKKTIVLESVDGKLKITSDLPKENLKSVATQFFQAVYNLN